MCPASAKIIPLDQGAPVAPQVYRWLRQSIIQGDIAPGARLSESEIALLFTASRQPVREAFIKLAEEGLVEVRPQRGTFVCKISVDAVMDARFVREAVEADIVKAVAANPSAALIADLRAQIDAQRHLVQGLSRDAGPAASIAFIQLDEKFHRSLAEAAQRTAAWRVIEGLKAQMDRVRYLATQRFPMRDLVGQHASVVEAIARADVAAAEVAMRGHLHTILNDLPQVVADLPDFFDRPQS